jgi:hypothetical protein
MDLTLYDAIILQTLGIFEPKMREIGVFRKLDIPKI